ncbi:MAG: SRPBCC family protein, partial [Melioribacteraceae bacterium]
MYEGQIIIYRIKLLPGIKINWVTEITHVEEGKFFVDEQRFGPYKFWHHQHRFNEVENGMEIHDIVHYAVPFGIPGILTNTIFIKNRLDKIFRYRKDYLQKAFN